MDADPPDVVLTDIRMPPSGTDEGIRAAAELRRTPPSASSCSASTSRRSTLALLEDGSEGRAYLLKDRVADIDDVVDAIQPSPAEGR